MWVVLVVLIIVLIAAAFLFQPQTEDATREDFEAPTAKEGDPVPVVFGTVDVKSANCVWYGDTKAEAIRSSGGKK